MIPSLLLAACFLSENTALLQAEQDAFRNAAIQAGPSVVRIETIGGYDKLGNVRLNTGATTGTVIGRDGWILSSAFNLAGEPSAIFVTLPDGRRVPAERVATDHVRQLVLLKADAAGLNPLSRAESTDVGRWAIAVGRTYDESIPNVSVGLVSALGRIGGLALQTDAKVSPANYGGPLVDVAGQGLGILVPMSPKTTAGGGQLAGIEWYDSGIGFAVPMADAIESARRLQSGDDLHSGRLGVSMAGSGLLDEPAVIERVHPNGPADRAGVQAGDIITGLNGQTLGDLRLLKLQLARLYAGDDVTLTLDRDGESFDASLSLVKDLPTFAFPYLGAIIDVGEDRRPVVRSVFPGTPAEAAFQPGDILTKIGDDVVATPRAAQETLQRVLVGEPLSVTVIRDESDVTVTLTPTELTAELPESFPLPVTPALDDESVDEDLVGRTSNEVLEGQVNYWVYTPPGMAAGQQGGVILWLADGGEAILPSIRSACHEHNVALVVPSPADGDWTDGDEDALSAVLDAVLKSRPVDSRRIVLVGSQDKCQLAVFMAQSDETRFEGVVLNNPRLLEPPATVMPDHRLHFMLIEGDNPQLPRIRLVLEKQGHPTTSLGDPFDEGAGLVRWVDWLGRL